MISATQAAKEAPQPLAFANFERCGISPQTKAMPGTTATPAMLCCVCSTSVSRTPPKGQCAPAITASTSFTVRGTTMRLSKPLSVSLIKWAFADVPATQTTMEAPQPLACADAYAFTLQQCRALPQRQLCCSASHQPACPARRQTASVRPPSQLRSPSRCGAHLSG